MATRVTTKIYVTRTGGAPVQSAARLISGTAVPCLTPAVNTVAPFDPTIFFSLASTTPPKKRTSKRARKASADRANFAMMPAYAARRELQFSESALLHAVNTPLETKAEEAMSEFERVYPW